MSTVEWKYKKRLDKLVDAVSSLDKQYASYGFYKDQGRHPEAKLDFPTLMAIHELREPTDPMYRPVFKISLKIYAKKIFNNNMKDLKNFIDTAAKGRNVNLNKLLEGFAVNGGKYVKRVFGSPRYLKPNTPSTAASKGKNSPMVEFGILKNNLSFKTSKRKSSKRIS